MNTSPEYTAALTALYALKSHEEIASLIRLGHAHLQNRARATFRYGQAVSFTARDGRLISGTVDGINPKTIKVRTIGGSWRVHPSLLRAA